MEQDSTTAAGGTGLFAGEAWFDPIEAGIRDRIRGFIEELLEQELTARWGARGTSGRRVRRKATATARASAGCWAASVPCKSACHVHAWPTLGAARGSGAAPRCPGMPG